MPHPVLRVEDLATTFLVDGEQHSAVRGVSFEVAPRETLAIVGESGPGKSVTALSIMRLVGDRNTAKLSGRVLLGGRDLLGVSEAEMEEIRGNEIAMIFQEPMTSLNPIMTVGEQISEALRRHRNMTKREARAESLDLLAKVRIAARPAGWGAIRTSCRAACASAL